MGQANVWENRSTHHLSLVLIIKESLLTTIATLRDGVWVAGKDDARLARHARRFGGSRGKIAIYMRRAG